MNTNPPGPEPGATYTSPPPRPHNRPPWRFTRRERGKVLAGVTTGMADAFHIDVTVVRVLWIVGTIATGGFGIAAYAICWIAFPSEYNPAPISQIHHVRHRSTGYIVGVVLLGIGAAIVLGQLIAMRPFRHFGALAWATILIGGGLAVLFLRNTDDNDNIEPQPTPPPTSTDPPETPEAADPTTTEQAPPPPPSPTSSWAPTPPLPPTSSAWTQTHPWPVGPPPRPRRPRRRSFLTPVTISILLIGAGGAALLDSAGAVHLTVAGVLATGLLMVGIAMIVSTWYGRAHGLIPIGVLLLLATIPAVSIDVPISGGIGDHDYHPVTRTQIDSHYKLGIGQLAIDLRDAPVTNRATSISAQLGIGELSVDVPANVRVDVRSHVGAGHVELFGRGEGGWSDNPRAVAGANQRGVVHLDLRVGAGAIIVRRWSPNGSFLPNPFNG
jgi:phage shock protein PspC (stress-responsive transcriptional regulator)/predicted membrane protein